MSNRNYKGMGCRCNAPREERKKNWVVTARNKNYSAFNGYKATFSNYSEIRCTCCGAIWRTKADYVNSLPNVPKGEYIRE